MPRLAAIALALLFPAAAAGQFTNVINLPPDPGFSHLRQIGSDTQLNLFDGAFIDSGFDAGLPDGTSRNVEVNVHGGRIGNSLNANGGSTINVLGGSIRDLLTVNPGSTINISEGSIGDIVRVYSNAEVNVSGGVVGRSFTIGEDDEEHPNARVNVTGGEIGPFFSAYSGSIVNITGGSFGEFFRAYAGSRVDISGGSFGLTFIAGRGSGPDTPLLINISGGDFMGRLTAYKASVINISGGNLGRYVRADSGSELNISGGSIGDFFSASSDSTINLTGGIIGTGFRIQPYTNLTVTGGTMGTGFYAPILSNVPMTGGEFQLNGVPVEGTSVRFQSDSDVLTGTLSDGSVFVYSPLASDTINGVEFIQTDLPPLETAPQTLTAGQGPNGLRQGQSLSVSNLGELPRNFSAVQASLSMSGGVVGDEFESVDSQIAISGGRIGDGFRAYRESHVEISGGEIGASFRAFHNSTVNIRGGSFGRDFDTSPTSPTTLYGGEFRLNGNPISGPLPTLAATDVLSGTLEDGSPFVFSPIESDELGNATLVETQVPPIDASPQTLSEAGGPNGLRSGQTLTVNTGGVLKDNFVSSHATLNVKGGTVGERLEIVDSTLNVSSGTVGDHIRAYPGSVVNLKGGTIGSTLEAYSNTRINISGGVVEGSLRAGGFGIGEETEDIVVTISGGEIGRSMAVVSGSRVDLSGGDIGGDFSFFDGSELSFYGTEFFIDDADVGSTLDLYTPFVMNERDVVLRSILADGSVFEHYVQSMPKYTEFISPEASVTFTLVLPGDFDGDADVDIHDLLAYQRGEAVYPVGPSSLTQWQANLGENTAGDIDNDGDVDLADAMAIQRLGSAADLDAWLDRFGFGDNLLSAATAVPEPAAATLLLIAAWVALLTRPAPRH